jgi:hypothetical protein
VPAAKQANRSVPFLDMLAPYDLRQQDVLA